MSSYPTPPDSIPTTPTKQLSEGQVTPALGTDHVPSSSMGYTSSLLYLVDGLTSCASSTINTISWSPLVSGARMVILSMMKHSIRHGQLRILSVDGEWTFGSALAEPDKCVEIKVIRDTFWLRLVTMGDLGFAEAYMAGDCEVSDLPQVFRIFIRSRPSLASTNIPGISTLPSKLFRYISSLTNSRFANTLSNTIFNISAHYDLSNGMFSAFLSDDMTYSCAIFPELDADLSAQKLHHLNNVDFSERLKNDAECHRTQEEIVKGQDELEDAQMAKIRHIIRQADIRQGHRVLEIGSGWGSFAIEAVKQTGCTVDTITLSAQQKKLAEERVKKAGLGGRVRVWLMDYRALPESWKSSFDRVVSIEMLEQVGKEFTPGYFSVLDSVLKSNGVACFQVITIPESRFEQYQKGIDFIRKWIFPGGFLPTISFITDAIQVGANNRLIIDSVSNIGPHYARTLREWRRRFLQNFDELISPALRAEHPEMTAGDIEVFKRKWLYYFCYCEVGFSERILGDHIFTLVREGNREYGCTTLA